LARFAGGLKLYRRGNKYLNSMPPVVNLVSRYPVTCSINDDNEFVVEGSTLRLVGRLPLGTSKLLLKERVENGQQSELSLTMIDVAEWAYEGKGTLHTVNEVPRKIVDHFEGVLGCWKAAYSTDAGDFQEMKASWQCVAGNFLMPCVPSQILAERINVMSGVRHVSFTIRRHASWRAVIDKGRLHPAFQNPKLKTLWDNFVTKSR
jgi:hypothetical protein